MQPPVLVDIIVNFPLDNLFFAITTPYKTLPKNDTEFQT